MNTTKKVEKTIYDEFEEIQSSGNMSQQDIENIKGSNVNDNSNDDGGFTPPPSDDDNTNENYEQTLSNEYIEAECTQINNYVALAANSCQTPKFSVDISVIPEEYHSCIIPDDPPKLQAFITACEGAVETAIKILKKPNISVEEYHHLHQNARKQGFIALDAALKLSLMLNNIDAKKGGARTDLHPEKYTGDNRTQKQIWKEDFGLDEKSAYRIKDLTIEAYYKEKEIANKKNEIPTLSHALKYAKAKKNALAKAKKEAAQAIVDTDEVVCLDKEALTTEKYDIIYADFNKLEDGLNISSCANADCLLYLWTDKKQLANAIDYMREKGFQYADNSVFVRIKYQHGGKYFQDYHSHVLVGVKGNFEKPELRIRSSVAYEREVGEGSGDVYYKDVIKLLYPDKALLDLVTKSELSPANDNDATDDGKVSTDQEVCNA